MKSLIGLLHISAGLYFHIGEKERKCFIEELPNETLIHGKYHAQWWEKDENGLFCLKRLEFLFAKQIFCKNCVLEVDRFQSRYGHAR